MSVIFLLILASLVIAAVFLGAYVWAVRSGQFDDTSTPALRMLGEETTRIAPSVVSRACRGGPPGPAPRDLGQQDQPSGAPAHPSESSRIYER